MYQSASPRGDESCFRVGACFKNGELMILRKLSEAVNERFLARFFSFFKEICIKSSCSAPFFFSKEVWNWLRGIMPRKKNWNLRQGLIQRAAISFDVDGAPLCRAGSISMLSSDRFHAPLYLLGLNRFGHQSSHLWTSTWVRDMQINALLFSLI